MQRPESCKWFQMIFWLQFLGNFFDIFGNWPTKRFLILDVDVARTKSLEPPLWWYIRYYSTINCIHFLTVCTAFLSNRNSTKSGSNFLFLSSAVTKNWLKNTELSENWFWNVRSLFIWPYAMYTLWGTVFWRHLTEKVQCFNEEGSKFLPKYIYVYTYKLLPIIHEKRIGRQPHLCPIVHDL